MMITLSSSEKEVVRRCEESFNNGIAFIAKLLTFPSTAGNEADAQMFVADELRSLGMATDIWEPDQEELENHPAFITQRENFHESPNVVGVLKGCGQGRSLILNAHIDVVPEGDPETWKYGPWSGKVCDGRVYGRGASDMKGGLAAIVHALRCITGHGIRLRGDVIVESVVAEEDGGAGTLACALRGYKADAAIIPEPSQMKIFPAVQGSKWFRVIVEGVPAHGGSRFDGISALEKAIRIHNGIIDLENYRAKKIRHPLYAKPVPFPINIGKISGGTWPSAVPGSVTLEGRIGVAPGETIEEAQHMMEKWIREEASHDPWLCDHLPKVEFFGAHWRPSDIPLDHPIITLTREIYENFAGQPEITGAPWGTDGGILMDYASTPALVFGPGTTEMAHKVDEYLELDNLLAYIKILSLIIMRWCGVE